MQDRLRPGSAPMFELGKISVTPSAEQALARLGIRPDVLINRHKAGDWGNLDNALMRENVAAVVYGFRILSLYRVAGEIFYVVTEADRGSTTIFLHEYY
jgi:hypothetical protein